MGYESSEDTKSAIPDAESQAGTQEDQPKKKVFTEDEVGQLIKERLANKEIEHKRKTETIKKRLEELESKEKKGTATNEEQLELSKAKTTQANAIQQGVPHEAIPYMLDEEMAKQKFTDSIKNAAEKDAGFKALLTPESKRLINDDQMFFLRDLPNSPAVLKKLLSDRKENNLMQAKFQEMIAHGKPSLMVEYINNLSDKLEKSAEKPRASSFSPDPDLSDFGDSSQDFELGKYVSGHR